jgi:predicted SAM-dependent methyltransferase
VQIDPRNPTGDFFKNRDFLIAMEHAMFERCQQGHGLFLNLGCGLRLLDNFVNIDKYTQHPRVRNEDISYLPSIEAGSVDLIFSAHSLEHIRHRLTRRTLRRWSEVLRDGGELWLSMPDLQGICEGLTRPASEEERWWLKATLFGYQAPGGTHPLLEDDDPGQYHVAGYTSWEMEKMLEQVGIKSDMVYRYDGMGTPSFFILGRKLHAE